MFEWLDNYYKGLFSVQMYLEGSKVVKANNQTAFSYFKKAADKVTYDWISFTSSEFYYKISFIEQKKVFKYIVCF